MPLVAETRQSSSSGGSGGRHTGAIAAVVVIVIAVVFIGALEVPFSPVSCTTQGTVLIVQTTTVASTVTYTTAVPIQQSNTQTKQVYNLASTTIPANQYVYQSAQLTTGMDVQVTWSAANTLNLYVFSSTQYAAYASSGTTSPNIANMQSSQSGSLSFHVSGSDTYYFVIFNPHNGLFGIGSQPVGLFSATGTATFQGTTTTLVTQTTSSVTFVPQQVTSTQTTTGATTHTVNLLSQIGGTTCSG